MKKANVYQILSEDHVVEALTKYLREPPFKLDFDELEIVHFTEEENSTEHSTIKVEVLLTRGSNEI